MTNPFKRLNDWFWLKVITFIRGYCILIPVVLVVLAGCQSAQVRQQIQQAQDQSAVKVAQEAAQAKSDVAAVKHQAAVTAAKAEASPTSHPLASIDQMVAAVRKAILPFFVVSILVVGVLIGMDFTPLSFISKVGLPIAIGASGLMLVNLIALPFLPWGFAVIGGAAVVLLTVESIRYKSLPKGIQAFGAVLGLAKSPVTASAANAKAAIAASTPVQANLTAK